MTPTLQRFLKRWDAVNAVLFLTLVVLTCLLSGCAAPTMPVGTFAITVHEESSHQDPCPATSPESSSGNALQPKDGAGLDFLQYSVRVKVQENSGQQTITGYGSGVLVPGGVLTAAHVVQTQSPPSIQCEANGQIAYGTTYRTNKDADLAYVAVTWPSPQVTAPIATRMPTAGDSVTTVGRGPNGDVNEIRHTVTAIRKWDRHTEIEVSPTFNQGRSGGGMFDSAGGLCGVVSMAVVHPEQKGIATGLDAIHELLKETSDVVVSGSSEFTAWIVTRSDCYPCREFHDTRGNGVGGLKYRYIQTDQPQPADVPDDVWRSAIEGAKARPVPFAMWKSRISVNGQPPGHYTATAVVGLTHEQLHDIVAFSGVPN
jgi:hypothetical protein